jgi:hypothetical protein
MLITNLSVEELEDAAFAELYHKRWPIDRNIPRKEYLKKPHFHHNHKSNC